MCMYAPRLALRPLRTALTRSLRHYTTRVTKQALDEGLLQSRRREDIWIGIGTGPEGPQLPGHRADLRQRVCLAVDHSGSDR